VGKEKVENEKKKRGKRRENLSLLMARVIAATDKSPTEMEQNRDTKNVRSRQRAKKASKG